MQTMPSARPRRNVTRTPDLFELLERDPKAYHLEVHRLHRHEPETFERHVRSVQRSINLSPGFVRRWPVAKLRAFILGDPAWMNMPFLAR